MLNIYLSCGAFGLVLVGVSALSGGDFDTDTDVDADIDIDADIDVDADIEADLDGAIHVDVSNSVEPGVWLPFLTIRFWTFTLATFGLVGTSLSMAGAPLVVHLTTASVVGPATGWIAAWLFQKLKHSTTDSTSHLERMAGLSAEVILPIRGNNVGKIQLHQRGQFVELPAKCDSEKTIEIGEKVLIVSISEGCADVTPHDKI